MQISHVDKNMVEQSRSRYSNQTLGLALSTTSLVKSINNDSLKSSEPEICALLYCHGQVSALWQQTLLQQWLPVAHIYTLLSQQGIGDSSSWIIHSLNQFILIKYIRVSSKLQNPTFNIMNPSQHNKNQEWPRPDPSGLLELSIWEKDIVLEPFKKNPLLAFFLLQKLVYNQHQWLGNLFSSW